MVDDVKVILGKKETVYGTDPVPTVIANAVVTRNFAATPIENDQLDRNLDLPSLGRSPSAPTNERQRVSFELELAGSGAAGTAAPWMEFLEGCGMAVPILTANSKAEQKMAAIGVAKSSLAFRYWYSNQQTSGLGARGTFGWDFTAGAYPFLRLDYTAIVPPVPLSTSVPGAPTLDRWKTPVEVNDTNTEFLLDGYAAVLQSFTGDANANVRMRNLVGARYVQRGNHGITGRILCEAPELASKNYFNTLRTGQMVATSMVHGTVAGNIVEASTANLQILSIARTVQDDVLMLDIGYGMNVVTGADDILFAAK